MTHSMDALMRPSARGSSVAVLVDDTEREGIPVTVGDWVGGSVCEPLRVAVPVWRNDVL